MSTKTITVYGIELEIEYTYHPPYKGARDSLAGIPGAGPPLEPDEEEYFEFARISHKGEDITDLISESALDKIEEQLWGDSDDYFDYEED